MFRIIYLSSASYELSDSDINNILEKSRINNRKNDISGLLLYAEGNFIQILEGNKKNIEETFQRIQKDSRHKSIIVVSKEKINSRSFSDWSMGYTRVSNDFLKENNAISPFNPINNSKLDTTVRIFLETFLSSFRSKVSFV